MVLLNRPASRVARRLLAALAALALTVPTTPAFALRGTIEAGAEEKVAEALHPAASPNVGLEEDVSRFAPPEKQLSEKLSFDVWSALSAEIQERATSVWAAHAEGIQQLQPPTPDYEQARRALSSVAKQWADAMTAIQSGNAPEEPTAIPTDATAARRALLAAMAEVKARALAGAIFAEARAEANKGPGLGLQYYATVGKFREADPRLWTLSPLKGLVKAIGEQYGDEAEAFSNFPNSTVIVTNRIRVFVAPGVQALQALQNQMAAYYGIPVPSFPVYDPEKPGGLILPPNAVLILPQSHPIRSSGLRADIVALDEANVRGLDSVIQQMLTYQLGRPVGRPLGYALVDPQQGTTVIFA